LRFTIDPPPVQPLIERTYPLHADFQKRIEELIWRHELPEIQLIRLDAWDGIVRPPNREQEKEPDTPEEAIRNPAPDPDEPENNIVRIKDWRSPVVICYDRLTGCVWQEGEAEELRGPGGIRINESKRPPAF
jgi:hypothetical protein